MTEVVLTNVRGRGPDLAGAIQPPTRDAIARAAVLVTQARAHHAWVDTGGRDGAPARLDEADLRPAGDAFRGLKLTAISAKGANLAELDMTGVQLQGANLEGCDLARRDPGGRGPARRPLGGADLTRAT
jgi:uncharacterized protein YjbI with pentapeptide repeats